MNDADGITNYRLAWRAANKLMFEGRSWSGRERNCVFLNTGETRWADVSAVSGIDFPDDGRALCVTDWDHDGDLDLWINNRGAPRLRFLRNDGCSGAGYLALRLQGVTCNRDAIGARVKLTLGKDPSKTKTQIRTLYAGDASLAQSTKWLHFGLGDAKVIASLDVSWPDGTQERFSDVEPNGRYRLVQGTGRAQSVAVESRRRQLTPSIPKLPNSSAAVAVRLLSRLPVPTVQVRDFQHRPIRLGGPQPGPVLVNLWASWCRPCIAELTELKAHEKSLRQAGLSVTALSVDSLESKTDGAENARKMAERMSLPFTVGLATPEAVDKLDAVQRVLLDVQQPLPLPSSFLLDRHGRVAMIYKGPVAVDQLLEDVAALNDDKPSRRQRAMPFSGRQKRVPAAVQPMQIALLLFEGGHSQYAQQYLRQLDAIATARLPGHEEIERVEVLYFLATLLEEDGKSEQSMKAYRDTLAVNPDYRDAHRNLGRAYLRKGQLAPAVQHLRQALRIKEADAPTQVHFAEALYRQGDVATALVHLRRALQLQPDPQVANNLAWVLATHPDPSIADAPAAVKWAEMVCRTSGNRKPEALNTLAAAYARSGRFADAVRTVTRSIEFARAANMTEQVRQSEAQLRLYKAGKPYLEK